MQSVKSRIVRNVAKIFISGRDVAGKSKPKSKQRKFIYINLIFYRFYVQSRGSNNSHPFILLISNYLPHPSPLPNYVFTPFIFQNSRKNRLLKNFPSTFIFLNHCRSIPSDNMLISDVEKEEKKKGYLNQFILGIFTPVCLQCS